MDRIGIIHYLRTEIERMQAWQQRHQSRKQYAEETGQEKLWLLGIADAFTEEMLLQEELDSMFHEIKGAHVSTLHTASNGQDCGNCT